MTITSSLLLCWECCPLKSFPAVTVSLNENAKPTRRCVRNKVEDKQDSQVSGVVIRDVLCTANSRDQRPTRFLGHIRVHARSCPFALLADEVSESAMARKRYIVGGVGFQGFGNERSFVQYAARVLCA